MKKYIFTLLCLISIATVSAQTPIVLSNTEPANNAAISTIQNIELTFDFNAVYSVYYDIPTTDWGIACSMNTSTTSRRKNIRLYKGTETTDDATNAPMEIYVDAIYYNSATFTPGKTTYQIHLNNEYQLDPNETYTLVIDGKIFFAATSTKNYTTETQIADPIILTFTGAQAELTNVIMDSYLPANTNDLKSLDNVDVTFKFQDGYGISVAEGATAYLQEQNQADIPATSITVDETDKNTVHFNFGNTTLYNGHTYNIYIPENTVYPIALESPEEALTDKGNKAITIPNYKGASYKYLTIGRITPRSESELSYLSVVTIPFDFAPGYGISRTAKPEVKLYKGENLIGTYESTPQVGAGGVLTTVSIDIWKFDLEPSSTYRLVMEEGQIPTATTGVPVSPVPDTSNPEIVITYTTPEELETVDKVAFQSSTPASGTEVEKLEDITLTFARYIFNNTDYSPTIADGEKKAGIYDVTNGEETLLQDVELSVAQEGSAYCAKGTVNRTLYRGKTYELRIPAGYFGPNNEHLKTVAANEAATFTFTGATDPYGMTDEKSSIREGAAIDALGMVAFYFKDEVTEVGDANVELYKGEASEAVKTAPVRVAHEAGYTRVYADFSDASAGYAPYATEEKAAYRLSLPKGSLASAADENLMNGELSVNFTGMMPTEYVHVTYTADNTSAQTKVASGNTVSYTITPESDWEVKSLLFNNNEVKNEIVSGTYTTPALTTDATLALELEYTGATYTEEQGSGIVSIPGSDLRAYSKDSKLVVENLAKGDAVTVYSIGGSVLLQFTATDDKAVIDVPANATYLVKVGNMMMKLLNK